MLAGKLTTSLLGQLKQALKYNYVYMAIFTFISSFSFSLDKKRNTLFSHIPVVVE